MKILLLILTFVLSLSADSDLDKDMTTEQGLQLSLKALSDKDTDRALEIWELLCDREDGVSCFNLGFYKEVKGNKDEAIGYYKKSCRSGFSSGCDKIKTSNQSGAIDAFLKSACENGDKSSCETRKLLKKHRG